MSAHEQYDNATQSAPPWPLTPKNSRQNPRLLSPNNVVVAPKIERIEEVEAVIDLKPDVDAENAEFITDTWAALAPVKFEPQVDSTPAKRLTTTTHSKRTSTPASPAFN